MSSDTLDEQQMNVDAILDEYRGDPYSYVDIMTIHTGVIRFKVAAGDPIEGPTGKWNHVPGTQLYELERERNCKRIFASDSGVISFLRTDLEGQFVEAGEKVMTIRHPLKKKEIIDRILRNVLYPVAAPERAKYFFAMEIQSRIEKFGQRSVTIKPGDELFTMSLMKRDKPVYYEGEPGIIHTVYFQPGISVNQGDPLIGICPPDTLPLIQKIINRVKAEWE